MNTKSAQRLATQKRTAAKTLVVNFEFTESDAAAVAIAGTFNDWRPDAAPMLAVGDGRWVKKLALSSGTYEYCFVVDGVWKPDPQATVTLPNPFGGLNTVLIVAAPATPMSSLQRPQEVELSV